jgi:hypothetical protein
MVMAGLIGAFIAAVVPETIGPTPVAPPQEVACFTARAVPIYEGLGWTHFVDVANGCATAIMCEVATDVDPFPSHSVMIPTRETRRVRTRVLSSTNRFLPLVRCTAARASSSDAPPVIIGTQAPAEGRGATCSASARANIARRCVCRYGFDR